MGFVARHAMVSKVRGSSTAFDAKAHLDAANPAASTAEVTIQVTSIDTGNGQRDEHLRTNDFFDAPTHPVITFDSTGVEVRGADAFALVGDLTIKGTTKSVTVEFEHTGMATDVYGNVRAGFEGRAVINRTDLGVTWNAPLEAGGVLVSDKITLELDVSAIKA
ncbi:MAG: YceI family protein [Frankiaceae bacterium]|nr:YceI family protein [Frankiaceae bacterium]